MKITVFGASGGIGTRFIDLAVEHGHSVRAVYRTAPPIAPAGPVEVLVNADIYDPDFVAGAIRGADVVVTALGPNFATRHNALTRMTSPPDLHQRLARVLVAAMERAGGGARVISVSTGSMGPGDAVMNPGRRILLRFFRTIVARNLRTVGRDLVEMEKELAGSGLDWFAVRPSRLTDGPLTGHVVASERFTMKAISRADVAWYLLALAENPEPPYRTPMIAPADEGRARQPGRRLARGRTP